MARTDINKPTQSLQSDDGSVLFSLIMGEQLEYPITLKFLSNAYGYVYEAALIEADNIPGVESIPDNVKPLGAKTSLNVRVPPERGEWSAATAYDREDVVYYAGLYYKLSKNSGYTSATPPSEDPLWVEYVPNKIYVQFPETLASDWQDAPTASVPVYGFLEVKVSEPESSSYKRIWKPVRGVVEFCFSPTSMMP